MGTREKRRRLSPKTSARAQCEVALRCAHISHHKPHACLCIELPHLTRILLVTLATRTNIKADSFSLCVPRLDKSLTGYEKGLCLYDRAASPLGRRQVNGHCLQGVFFISLSLESYLSELSSV